jgi:aspartate racemase
MEKNTIGILGGMGPEATAALFQQIIRNTRADTDQDHLPVLIYNNPKIPDRSAYILGKGPDPVPALTEGSRFLQEAGVCCVLWPCNTAYYFHETVSKQVSIPILHMIRETAVCMKMQYPSGTRFGLLATLGIYQTGTYDKIFREAGLDLVIPDEKNRQVTMDAIYGAQGIKAGYHDEPLQMLVEPVADLKAQGANVLIAGCTELSLVLTPETTGIPVTDPMVCVARAAIKKAGGRCK